VLVVRYGEHFLLGQITEAKAVFECEHTERLCFCDRRALICIKRFWRGLAHLWLARVGSGPPSSRVAGAPAMFASAQIGR